MDNRKSNMQLPENIKAELKDFFPDITNLESHCQPFSGGYSGRAPFKINYNGKMYVVRELNLDVEKITQPVSESILKLPLKNQHAFNEMKEKFKYVNIREYYCNLKASEANFGPKLHNKNPMVLITDLAEGVTMKPTDFDIWSATTTSNLYEKNEKLKTLSVINCLIKLHQAPIDNNDPKLTTLSVHEWITLFYSLAQIQHQHNDNLNHYLFELDKRIDVITNILQQQAKKLAIPTAFTHGDITGGNILLEIKDDEPKLSLIDWTDGGLGDPYYDLAKLVNYMYSSITKSAADDNFAIMILNAYEIGKNQKPPSPALIQYFLAMRDIVYLRQGLWALSRAAEVSKDIPLNFESTKTLTVNEMRTNLFEKKIDLNSPEGFSLMAKCYIEKFKNSENITKYINAYNNRIEASPHKRALVQLYS
jgi:thiamine kinase-like enzyme